MGREVELKKLLYRAVVELSYIQETACEYTKRYDLIATTEGADIIEQGMRLLGVKDLSVEAHMWEPEVENANELSR